MGKHKYKEPDYKELCKEDSLDFLKKFKIKSKLELAKEFYEQFKRQMVSAEIDILYFSAIRDESDYGDDKRKNAMNQINENQQKIISTRKLLTSIKVVIHQYAEEEKSHKEELN